MQRFLERLAWLDSLLEGEQDRLIKSVSEILAFDAGGEIVPAETPGDFSSIILEGFSFRQKVLKTGAGRSRLFTCRAIFVICMPTC
jgi:hypothetical protein